MTDETWGRHVDDFAVYSYGDGDVELGIDGVEWRGVSTSTAREYALAILAACMVAEAASKGPGRWKVALSRLDDAQSDLRRAEDEAKREAAGDG